ncbi:MAG: 1-acyl-sn-glycerol-3-phosphate acyltransferase [Elusimicrobiota bacterium]|jgi:1-acyl-sn-glycerol-3-phosphate acyltransferase|nr:1-acyl-sn-glycerol-3-phosphate acyltransferase [Elusimicrobiota bacterium]
MVEFFKRAYAFPFVAGTWTWLAVSGFFVYFFFCISGFKESRARSFIYFQGRVLQTAVLFVSAFHKKIIKGTPIKNPSILVANHPSTYDTFVFFDFGIKNIVYVAKNWPFQIPFYGKIIKEAGYINTEGKTADEIISQAKERLKKGLHIGIFPEGTRSGTEIGRFRSLAFKMSIETGAEIVPFAIKGLGEMLAPKQIWAKKADIEYKQLEKISPDRFCMEAGDLKMAKAVKEIIVEELNKGL